MALHEPFAQLEVGTRRTLNIFALVSTAVLTIALGLIDLPLRTRAAPSGIITFELAGSMPKSQAILASWNGEARIYAGLSLGLDYAYLAAYSTALAFACSWASRRGSARWCAAGHWLCWGQWLAALFDASENFALIRLLLGSRWPAWPVLATACALLKFALLSAGALYTAAGAAKPRARGA